MIRSRRADRRSPHIRAITRFLIAAYLVEAGLLLAFAPWMQLWHRNAFAVAVPWLLGLMANPFVRGAVTGIGLVTLGAGIRDLASVFVAGRGEVTPAAPHDDHAL